MGRGPVESESWKSDVSRETQERLARFLVLFDKWSAKTNLVARSTRASVVRRHVADSLQLLDLTPEPAHWVDLGSGAGFPGLIVAIAYADIQAGWVDLVESNRKKAAFLRAAIVETGARAAVHATRIEAAQAALPLCDRVSARALTDLEQLLALSRPWFEANRSCQGWFHKGRDYRREVDKARGRWRFDLVEHRSSLEPDSVILQIENLESL